MSSSSSSPITRVINITPDEILILTTKGDPVPYRSESTSFLFQPNGVDAALLRSKLNNHSLLKEAVISQFKQPHWMLYSIVPKHAVIVTDTFVAELINEIGVEHVFPGRRDLIIASPESIHPMEFHRQGTPLRCRAFCFHYDGRA
jgi:hypothetical protein